MAQTEYSRVDTQKLKFCLGVGRAGLTMWKGKRLAEVRRQLAEIEKELKSRGEAA